MFFQTNTLNSVGIAHYDRGLIEGISGSNYVRLTSEVVQYVTNITIENEWLEQPPQVTNRNQLANGCKRIRIWF